MSWRIAILIFLLITGFSSSQEDVNNSICVTVVNERYNCLILNEENYLDFKIQGESLISLKLQCDKIPITKKGNEFYVTPTNEDTVTIEVINIKDDSVIFKQQFVIVEDSELSNYQNSFPVNSNNCSYVVSRKQNLKLIRNRENRLLIKSQGVEAKELSIKVENGKVLFKQSEEVIIVPDNEEIVTIGLFHGSSQVYSSQFIVVNK